MLSSQQNETPIFTTGDYTRRGHLWDKHNVLETWQALKKNGYNMTQDSFHHGINFVESKNTDFFSLMSDARLSLISEQKNQSEA